MNQPAVVRFAPDALLDKSAILQQRLETATHVLRGWLWETDRDHRFTYLSHSVLTFTGRPPEWHYGKTRQELDSYHIEPETLAKLEQQLANREPFGPMEYERVYQDGKSYWVRTLGMPRFDGSGDFTGYQGIAHDIGPEVRARIAEQYSQNEVEKKHSILKATVECFPIAISVFDNAYNLALANAHYYSVLDLPPSQFPIGANFADIIRYLVFRGEIFGGEPEDLIRKHIRLAQSGEIQTFTRTRPNGLRLKIISMPLPHGGLIRTYNDVTRSIEMSERLQMAAREAAKYKTIAESLQLENDRLQRLLNA